MTTEAPSWAIDAISFSQFRAILEKTGRLRCRVASDSMAPLLKIEDWIEIEPIRDPATLRRFDIVVYRSGDRLFCHFMWSFNRVGKTRTITTRSLKKSMVDDSPISVDSLLGRVTSHKIPLWTKLRIVWRNIPRRKD